MVLWAVAERQGRAGQRRGEAPESTDPTLFERVQTEAAAAAAAALRPER